MVHNQAVYTTTNSEKVLRLLSEFIPRELELADAMLQLARTEQKGAGDRQSQSLGLIALGEVVGSIRCALSQTQDPSSAECLTVEARLRKFEAELNRV